MNKSPETIKIEQEIVLGTAINRAANTFFSDHNIKYNKIIRNFLTYLDHKLQSKRRELDAIENNSETKE